MGQNYLIDTNIVIDNLGNKLPHKAKEFVRGLDIVISSITKIELLGWFGATAEQLKPIKTFLEIADILEMDEILIDKTIEIRQVKKIGLGDAFIAATAIVHNATLVTRNTSDFKNIKGLTIINPYELD